MRVIDNFLSTYAEYKRYTDQANFKIETFGNKDFFISKVPEHLQKLVYDKIKRIFSFKDEFIPTLCYFRKSTPDLDIDVRIHTDQNHCEFVSILYMSEDMDSLNGTAFWDHKKYGKKQPRNISDEEFNKLLTEDSGNINNWELNTVLGYEQNRLISYPANYFHSRYPNKSWESGRQVFVMFYKIK